MPILSIVVPTHERSTYAISTVRCLLQAMPDDVEVVVRDTSETDLITPALQHETGWARVRLVRPTGTLSGFDLFTEGLRQASGRYLLLIADDDFVNPALIDLLRQADREQVDAITFSTPALYFWPDGPDQRRDEFSAGRLQIDSFTGSLTATQPTQPTQVPRRAPGEPEIGVGDMPRICAAVVSRSVVDRAIPKHRLLFGSANPDRDGAALLVTEAVHCIRIDYPMVIPGVSEGKAGAPRAPGDPIGERRSSAQIAAVQDPGGAGRRFQSTLAHEILQQPDSLHALRALCDWLRDHAPALELPQPLPGPRRALPSLELTPQGRPLLSIVLPSCNRQAYLKAVLLTLLEVTAAELVVSDNSDIALTPEELAAVHHGGRLKYQHVTDRLSVVENFERGLHLAQGEYLLFLGDDDCVGPGIENLVRWAREQGIEALVSYGNRFIANYYWPGVKSKYFDDGYAGKLFLNRFSGRTRLLDGPRESWLASRNPGAGLGRMPRAYHGLVSRSLVERVLQRHGRLFGGVSPDVYSATLIAHEVKGFAFVDYPFVIPGGSAPSTAGEGAARSDVDKLDAREHIKRFGDSLVWDPRIPSFYSPITVWAYSQQMALNALGERGYDIDFARLYLKCLLFFPKHRQATQEAMRHWLAGRSAASLLPAMAWSLLLEIRHLVSRVWYRFVRRPESLGELAQIGAAYRELEGRVPPWQPPAQGWSARRGQR